jgi:hypothetical protein
MSPPSPAQPVRPLPPGTLVGYADMTAKVLEDFGGASLTVLFEGERVKWYWTLDGETCKVLPTQH